VTGKLRRVLWARVGREVRYSGILAKAAEKLHILSNNERYREVQSHTDGNARNPSPAQSARVIMERRYLSPYLTS